MLELKNLSRGPASEHFDMRQLQGAALRTHVKDRLPAGPSQRDRQRILAMRTLCVSRSVLYSAGSSPACPCTAPLENKRIHHGSGGNAKHNLPESAR